MSVATVARPARPLPTVRAARLPIAEMGRVLLYALLAVAVVLFAFLAVGPRVFGYRTVTMLTGSMRPQIPPGAVAVDVPEPTSSLRVGQVVTFHAPEPGAPVLTHRVVSVRRVDGRVLIRTKGDANSAPDPWLAVLHGSTVWRVRGVVPYLGFGIHAARSGVMRTLVIWVLPAAALAWFLVAVWRPAPATEGGVPACPEPARPPSSRSPSRRCAAPRSRSRKRRQRQARNCRRRQRRSSRRSR